MSSQLHDSDIALSVVKLPISHVNPHSYHCTKFLPTPMFEVPLVLVIAVSLMKSVIFVKGPVSLLLDSF